jgi:acetyl esterase/lipase
LVENQDIFIMDNFILPPEMNTTHIKRKWLNRQYANQSPTQKLDIYLPDAGDGPFPVIASIHGGAWMIGDKGDTQNSPMMEGLKRGYAVACINYRLSGEAQFPAQIFDCKAAIRYLRANAAPYYLDPNRIAAWGSSAGAHLAALVGTTPRVRKLEDFSTGNPKVSSKVQAIVSWYGPIESFLKMDEELSLSGMGVPDHSGPDSPESRLLGDVITAIPARVSLASPMTHIKRYAPPFLVQHGLRDEIVPVEQSIRFAEQFARIAGQEKISFEILPDARHADPLFETPANVIKVLDFLDAHLKK